jgi:hypothetical protein
MGFMGTWNLQSFSDNCAQGFKNAQKMQGAEDFSFFQPKIASWKFSAYGKDCHVGIFTHQSVVILFA